MSEGKLKQGDFVKIRHSGERFWCEILGRDDSGLNVRVNNNLIVAPFKLGDVISIQESDIIEMMRAKE